MGFLCFSLLTNLVNSKMYGLLKVWVIGAMGYESFDCICKGCGDQNNATP